MRLGRYVLLMFALQRRFMCMAASHKSVAVSPICGKSRLYCSSFFFQLRKARQLLASLSRKYKTQKVRLHVAYLYIPIEIFGIVLWCVQCLRAGSCRFYSKLLDCFWWDSFNGAV